MKVKMVRDKCPEVYEDWPEGTKLKAVNSAAGKHALLLLKLHEEAAEIGRDATNPEEYADVLSIILALARLNGVSWADVEQAFVEKNERLGGFDRGIVYTLEK